MKSTCNLRIKNFVFMNQAKLKIRQLAQRIIDREIDFVDLT